MKLLYIILNWMFGIVFLVLSLLLSVGSLLGSLSLILVSLLLLPPARNFIYAKTNKKLPIKVRGVLILGLCVACVVFVGQSMNRDAKENAALKAQAIAEQIAEDRRQNIDYFNQNSLQILTDAKAAFDIENFQEVVAIASKYSPVQNAELIELSSQAKLRLKEIAAVKLEAKKKAEREAKTQQILTQLRDIPASQYKKNRDLYKQLVALSPRNETYQSKVEFYSKKVAEVEKKAAEEQEKRKAVAEKERKKQVAAETRTKRIESQFSPWDGSHRNLERVIEESMNDPDSYDHVETVYWDRGDHLIVRTTFRGKNAFGGVVKNSLKAKVSLDGQVLQILDQQ